ncbi:MAG: hypothetical protein CVV55_04020 [Synergistetes bacterium HGW-Synergistetes-2]|nr:MAG: hypothetical protein CVV55_04020 [Synergistetes bacterium HGW-Synergistetes-2]
MFPSIYPPHLLPTAFGSMDFVLFCRLVQLSGALYEVHVLRAASLSRASFRFRVAADTLASNYGYCCLHRSGLAPGR